MKYYKVAPVKKRWPGVFERLLIIYVKSFSHILEIKVTPLLYEP